MTADAASSVISITIRVPEESLDLREGSNYVSIPVANSRKFSDILEDAEVWRWSIDEQSWISAVDETPVCGQGYLIRPVSEGSYTFKGNYCDVTLNDLITIFENLSENSWALVGVGKDAVDYEGSVIDGCVYEYDYDAQNWVPETSKTLSPKIAYFIYKPAEAPYSRDITITEQSGNNLEDYAVLVELDESFDYSKTREDGKDIVFYDGNTKLKRFIEEFDTEGEKAKIWVRVNIAANKTKTIKMKYGSGVEHPNDADTFTIYDGFEEGLNEELWDLPQNYERKEDGFEGAYYLRIYGELTSKKQIPSNVEVRFASYLETYLRPDGGVFYTNLYAGADYVSLELSSSRYALVESKPPYWIARKDNPPNPTNEWKEVCFKKFGTSVSADVGGTTISGTASTDYNVNTLKFFMNYDWGRIDKIIVRPYTEPEPSISIGEEIIPRGEVITPRPPEK